MCTGCEVIANGLGTMRARGEAARKDDEKLEGKRSWWVGRASNPVGGAKRCWVGSTPIPLRHNLGSPTARVGVGAAVPAVRGLLLVGDLKR